MAATRLAKDVVKTLYGSGHARREQASYLASLGSLAPSLDAVESRASAPASKEAPIFVFSAGWRSGSTMVQRLLMSGGDALIWGEAYDRACIIQRLTETAFAHSNRWPHEDYLRQPASVEELAGDWVANLYPPLTALKAGYRALIENLFSQPARDIGIRRWGFKEVRHGVNEARFLHWLFPKAKFVFVYRNPFDAYRSYKAFQPARNWYVRWPDQPAFTATAFARHWRRLASDYLHNATAVSGMLVKYEDLVSGEFDLDALAGYCRVDIDRSVLRVRVGGTRELEEKPSGLSRLERLLIARATFPVAGQLGYRPR